MKPMLHYIKYLLARKRILGEDHKLQGLVKADALLTELVNQKKIPGLAITVLRKGEILLQKGYGYADLEQKIDVDPQNTLFRIASVSKPIAATALANMVAEGGIDLDASFYTYVPYYPKKKYDFTIRQLASHTAGIRGYRGTEYGLNEPYTIKEGINIFKDEELLFKPGTDYLYNSYDWVLISLAMEEASGVPFEDYVQEKVLQPLGMKNTFPEHGPYYDNLGVTLSAVEGPLKRGRSAIGHKDKEELIQATCYSKNRLGFRKAIPVDNYYKLAGGGYVSTSEDIAKLGQAYLDKKIVEEAVLSQFLTAQYINGRPTWYGLGWQVSEDSKGKKYYGHVGNGVGAYSNFFVYPEQQMVFSILIHCTNPKIQPELDAVIDCLLMSVMLSAVEAKLQDA